MNEFDVWFNFYRAQRDFDIEVENVARAAWHEAMFRDIKMTSDLVGIISIILHQIRSGESAKRAVPRKHYEVKLDKNIIDMLAEQVAQIQRMLPSDQENRIDH